MTDKNIKTVECTGELYVAIENNQDQKAKKILISFGVKERFAEKFADTVRAAAKRPYAVVTGEYEGATAQLYNYAIALIESVGKITNAFDPFTSLGLYAQTFLDKGYKNMYDVRSEHRDYRYVFIREYACVAVCRKGNVNRAKALYASIQNDVDGFSGTMLSDLQKTKEIVRELMYECDWTDFESLVYISLTFESVKRFYQENGIDATKQLPLRGLDIPYFKRFSYITKLSKVSYLTKDTCDWANGTFTTYLVKDNTRFFLSENRVRLHMIKKVGCQKFECVLDEDGNKTFTGVVEDIASASRTVIADYAMAQLSERVKTVSNYYMPKVFRDECLTAYNSCSQDFRDYVNFIKRSYAEMSRHFRKIEEKVLGEVKSPSDPFFLSVRKSNAKKKSAMKKSMINNLRIAYRRENIAPAHVSAILLGAILANTEDFCDIQSDFGRFLEQEWSLFFISKAESLGLNVNREVRSEIYNCVVPAGFEVEVNEDGLVIVDNTIVGELKGAAMPGKFTVVEDENGTYFASADIVDLLTADITKISAEVEDGIVIQLQFNDDNPESAIREMVGQEITLVDHITGVAGQKNMSVHQVIVNGVKVATYFNQIGGKGSKTNRIIAGMTHNFVGHIVNGMVCTVLRGTELEERKTVYLAIKGSESKDDVVKDKYLNATEKKREIKSGFLANLMKKKDQSAQQQNNTATKMSYIERIKAARSNG